MPGRAARLKVKTENTAENSVGTSGTPMEMKNQGSGERLSLELQIGMSPAWKLSCSSGSDWTRQGKERNEIKSQERKQMALYLSTEKRKNS